MRRDAEFGLLVHVARTNLHLERFVLRADYRGVNRAIFVALGRGDVIVELARNVVPQAMHDAEGRYRDALVRYLEAIYTGHDTVPTLADLCGVSYPTLDEQYRAFMTPSEATPTVEKTNSATEVTEGTEKNKKAT